MRFTTNASKTVTSANMPSAFGQASVTASTASAFSWNAKSGYRQDSVAPTGLDTSYSFQKVGDRYYDPTLLCFLTRDTELDQLPYTYCGGDPVNRVDPTGHTWRQFGGFLLVYFGVVVGATGILYSGVTDGVGAFFGGAAMAGAGGAMIGKGWKMMRGER